MILKLSTWLVVAVAGGALVAGCGSSSTSGTSTKSTTAGTSLVGQEAVGACDHNVQTVKSLSASAKTKLEAICAKAANGNPATLQQVAREACIEIVNASHLPTGLAKVEALGICSTVKAK